MGIIAVYPYHFLYLPEYKRRGHSQLHLNNSENRIFFLSEQNPNKETTVSKKKDVLCIGCSNDVEKATASNAKFLEIPEQKVRKISSLEEGKTYIHEEIVKNINTSMALQKCQGQCGDCHLKNCGLCKNTFLKNETIIGVDKPITGE